ncbi:MAG: protein kinase [Sandaracinaceae bacterium]|nr:protein kinase [Sandaracinaceae bacterium]
MRKPPVDPLIGRTIGGRYRLIQRLGSGGMSSVYLARHVLIDRLMAIKTLRRDLASDPVQRDRFIREARAVNRINHENIVEISDFRETEDGLLYLVMEYVPGESLLKAMGEGPFPPLRALDIAEQAASALARAHQMGVIHRDLKPENLLLVQRRDRPDFVKLLDFGIAKLTDQPSLTGSQQIFGTPGYIAPEYIQSANIDGRSDLYSLGVILYEMVTGALPFDYEYPGDLLIKHVTEPPIRPSLRRPGLPAPIEELVLRCLEKTPEKRFRDAFHFLEELRACRERLGSELEWGALARPEPSGKGGQRPVSVAPTPAEVAAPLPEIPIALPPDLATPSAPEPARTTKKSKKTAEPSDTAERSSTAEPSIPIVVEPPRPSTGTLQNPVSGVSGRPITADYNRRSIPVAPGDDLSIDIDIEDPQSVHPPPITAGPDVSGTSLSGEHGLAGTRRWRERFESLRACLDELVLTQSPPPDVDHAMAFAARALEELEESATAARREQRALEGVSEKARDFRATIGRTLDELAAQLSHEKGELDRLAAQRVALEARRMQLRSQGRETEADGVLWELAAVDQAYGEKAAVHEVLASQVAELQTQLDRENEQLEAEIAVLSQSLDREMGRLWPMAGALREPLDRVEAYVRDMWQRAGR